jgi:hypothetical protein
MPEPTIRLGNWKHYKGGVYAVLGLVYHHETRAPYVHYISHATGEPSMRPLKPVLGDPDAWDDWVEYEGKRVRRFAFLGPGTSHVTPTPGEPLCLCGHPQAHHTTAAEISADHPFGKLGPVCTGVVRSGPRSLACSCQAFEARPT